MSDRLDHGQVPGTTGAYLGLHCLVGIDGCTHEWCRCRCHAQLTEEQKARIRLAASEAARQALMRALAD
ncbi:MAG TPA: hypothetical protein VI172_08185 [Candidatus Dormibacteraeota bacterium]|jgi:hypothetical protein